MKKMFFVLTFISLIFNGCTSTAVKYSKYSDPSFNKDKYLGKWFEIARKENRFEKDLINVTAEYSLKNGKEIKVVNTGYNIKEKKVKVAVGKAKLNKDINNVLNVTFFWPFYADYIILSYDKENYKYALVRSSSSEYLWILSREPSLSKEIISQLLKIAENDGINTSDLIYTTHESTVTNKNQ